MITKRIIQISIATLFILTSSLAFGQINVDTDERIRVWQRKRELEKFSKMKESKVIEYTWEMLTKIDEGCYLMEMPQQHYYYLGDITSSRNGNYLRSGKGICSTANEYYQCTWKRDFKHGKGIMQKADGSFICAEWKWDKLQKDKARPATDEEIVAFKEEIERLHSLVRMCKR